ncbi:thioredoxin-like protein [Fimicolochytrium jonesii]|uniref:thioredoxin-like protein n=1 Tax=Fimicolochytrium jonesii TaxID=1396493 RepID=UPI0022FDB836|nr:thioredoxin-like protein [Fimicolochytrium jonesii]KAI8820167.1 thioredoxin-like protein [Fimicolochytrium jonesii]
MADFVDDEAIMHFIEVTGADPDIAKNYLQVSEGVVEQAVSLFMENGGAPLHTEAAASTSTSTGPSSAPYIPADPEVRAPIASKREALFDADMSPYNHRVAPRRSHAAASNNPFAQHDNLPTTPSLSNDPNSRLAEMFRPPTSIMHVSNSTQQARDFAKMRKKWLIITLNEPTFFPCQVLNRDLWKDPSVLTLIKEHFVFVYWVASSPPGLEHRNLYPFEEFPYIAIIDPITGERMKSWNTAVEPKDFMQDALTFLSTHSLFQAAPSPAKKTKVNPTKQKKTITELTEDEQLELALAASMGDAGPSKKPGDVVDLTSEKDADEDNEVEGASVLDLIKPQLNEEPTGSDALRIQFRLPDGSRKVRKFRPTDPVRTLFEYIRADVPEAGDKPFELMNFRDPLLPRLKETVADAKLAGASITVAFS